jgi:putative peptidoglycan lipid II flippase
VVLTTVLGYLFSIPLTRALGLDPRLGVAGLTISAGIAGWVEFVFLRRSLNRRIGRTGLSLTYMAKLWVGALAGAAVGWGFKLLVVGGWHPIPLAIVVLGGYGTTYFAVEYLFGIAQARIIIGRFLRFR